MIYLYIYIWYIYTHCKLPFSKLYPNLKAWCLRPTQPPRYGPMMPPVRIPPLANTAAPRHSGYLRASHTRTLKESNVRVLGSTVAQEIWEGWAGLYPNSLHLKITTWNLGDSYWNPSFLGAMLVSGRVVVWLFMLAPSKSWLSVHFDWGTADQDTRCRALMSHKGDFNEFARNQKMIQPW